MADIVTIKLKNEEVGKVKTDQKKDNKEVLLDIKVKEKDKEINIKPTKDEKNTEEIEVEVRVHGGEGEDGKYKTAKAKVEYGGGMFKHAFRFPKDTSFTIGSTTYKLTEPSDNIKFSGLHPMKWTFYASLAVMLLAIFGFIWWWISSSKKEDKEEETL